MPTKRVLVIDDERDIRITVQLSLNMLTDWEVLTAASGAEGMVIAQTEQPDAILLDVLMPGMNGWNTFQQIQANPVLRHIPVIFMTTNDGSTEQRMAKAQASGMIAKPFTGTDLVEKIRSLLNWKD